MPSGRTDDPALLALEQEASYLSHVLSSLRLINALNDSGIVIRPEERKRRKAIRQELRRILAAVTYATEERHRFRTTYYLLRQEGRGRR